MIPINATVMFLNLISLTLNSERKASKRMLLFALFRKNRCRVPIFNDNFESLYYRLHCTLFLSPVYRLLNRSTAVACKNA